MLKKKMKSWITEANRLAVEEFCASQEFTKEKVKFAEEAFFLRQDLLRQKIATYLPKSNLSLLDEGEAGDNQLLIDLAIEKPPQSELGIAEASSQ